MTYVSKAVFVYDPVNYHQSRCWERDTIYNFTFMIKGAKRLLVFFPFGSADQQYTASAVPKGFLACFRRRNIRPLYLILAQSNVQVEEKNPTMISTPTFCNPFLSWSFLLWFNKVKRKYKLCDPEFIYLLLLLFSIYSSDVYFVRAFFSFTFRLILNIARGWLRLRYILLFVFGNRPVY